VTTAETEAETAGETAATETTAATEPTSATTTEATTEAETAPPAEPATPERLTLVLRAARGDSWVQVRAGSATGRVLYEGFLFSGERRRFEAKQLWLRVGIGGNLDARLNGKPLKGLPAGTGDVLITADGVETLALA
jgi:hypothetical protein